MKKFLKFNFWAAGCLILMIKNLQNAVLSFLHLALLFIFFSGVLHAADSIILLLSFVLLLSLLLLLSDTITITISILF